MHRQDSTAARATPSEAHYVDPIIELYKKDIDRTLIRVGNGEYAKENDSFGLTTLRTRHLELDGTDLTAPEACSRCRPPSVGVSGAPPISSALPAE